MRTRAAVLGAGMTGVLAARVLAEYFDTVFLMERDELPRQAEPRKGLPQGRHAHVLMSGGVRAVEAILPGTTERWLAAGAHRIGLLSGYVLLLPDGWVRRWPGEQFVISCSRALLDWVIREQVLADPRIVTRQPVDLLGLTGDDGRVTGISWHDRNSGQDHHTDVDLVVDATGRGSRATRWLADLGYGQVHDQVVDSGLVYATRLFRAPGNAGHGFPVVNVQADPNSGTPGQTAALMPIENGQWLVTLSGTRGGEPTADPDRFVDFAKSLRHPIVGELIARAEPLGPVHLTRSTANTRHHFDKLPRWPDGFVVIGDAVASYNPVYGHGMSVAARGVLALRDRLARDGMRPAGAATALQRTVTRLTLDAWNQATATDARFPGAIGPRPTIVDRVVRRYMERLLATAASRPDVAEAVVEVFTLSAPANRLLAPSVALRGLMGPKLSPLPEPPFTERELSLLHD